MALHAHDHPPIPPELDDDPPLSDRVLESLDTAFQAADHDGASPEQMEAMYRGADPLEEPGIPAAAHLIPPEARGFAIHDDGAAEWAMRHVAAIDVELEGLVARRDEWAAKIDRWFAHGSHRLLRRRAFFVAHLIAYGQARRDANPKAPKTLSLPSGRITSQDVAPVVTAVDDEKLAVWLRERELLITPDGDDVVKVTTKVYERPLRKVLQVAGGGAAVVIVPTGEVLPTADGLPEGLEVRDGHRTFDVKPS